MCLQQEKVPTSKLGSSHFHADIHVNVPPGLLLKGSVVLLNHARARLHTSQQDVDSCHFRDVLSSEPSRAEDLCSERLRPCEHLCMVNTGLCECRVGFILDTTEPSHCLGEE